MIPRLLTTVFLAILQATSLSADGVFTTSGRDILLDGVEFEVKGVCYQPAAIGENPSTGYPFGDYYYTDANNSGIDEQYPARWARDFANFEKLGLNVIRVYGWDPNQDHSAFLSMAEERDMYVLINRYIDPNADFTDASGAPGYQPSAAVVAYAAEWTAIANENANNPAVMGFLIGNETNASDPPNFFEAMNYLAGIVKGIAPDKLVSTAITDRIDQVIAHDATVTNFNFWALQIYRGYTFDMVFADYAAASNKPMIITECGHDALDGRLDAEWPNDAEMAGFAVGYLWNDMRIDEAGADICSGAVFFEYADEWWKDSAAGQNLTHNFGPRWAGPYIDNEINEEWWGIFRVIDNGSGVDILEPREAFYTLAAMWNEPEAVALEASSSGDMVDVYFERPIHLRKQGLLLESSPDLFTWTPVAHNAHSTYLSPIVGSVDLTNSENGDLLEVTMSYDIDGAVAASSLSLLSYGGFEIGWPVNWTTGGTASDSYVQGGSNFSLQLDAPGGFTVPVAFQEFSANPGDEFNFSGWMLTPTMLPAAPTNGLLKIVFQDAMGNDLPPASISIGQPNVDFPGAESTPMLTSASTPDVWHFSQAQAVAPAGTVSVRFFAITVDESPVTMYFDSLEAKFLPPVGPTGPTLYFRATSFGG